MENNIRTHRSKKDGGERKKFSRKFWITVICCLLVVGTACGFLVGTLVNRRLDKGDYLREATVYETDNFKVDAAMFTYYFYCGYEDFLESGTYDTSAIDTDKPLKKQTYKGDKSWFDYFLSIAKTKARSSIIFAEAAKKEGYTLTDEETAEIKEYAGNIDVKKVGRGIKTRDIEEAEKLVALGDKYYEAVGKAAFTEDEYKKKLQENLTLIGDTSYYAYEVKAGSLKESQSLAQTIAEATDPSSFLAAVNAVAAQNGTEQFENAYDMLKNDVKFGDCGKTLGKWLFDEDRKAGETKVISGKNSATVYMVDRPPMESDSSIVNLRVLHLNAETTDEIIQKNKEILDIQNEFIIGGKDEKTFASLVKKYSEDTAKKADGGLYTDYKTGDISDDKFSGGLNTWCISPDRKTGDFTVAQSNTGLDLIYISFKDLRWKAAAEKMLLNGWKSEFCDTLEENVKLKYYSDAVSLIPIK